MIPFSQEMVNKAMEMVAEAQAKEMKRQCLKNGNSTDSKREETKTATVLTEIATGTESEEVGATASSFSVVSPKTATLANEILQDESEQSKKTKVTENEESTEEEDSDSIISGGGNIQ